MRVVVIRILEIDVFLLRNLDVKKKMQFVMFREIKEKLYENNKQRTIFTFIQFICAIFFTIVAVFMVLYSSVIFKSPIVSLCVNIFCVLHTISIWEDFQKNFKVLFSVYKKKSIVVEENKDNTKVNENAETNTSGEDIEFDSNYTPKAYEDEEDEQL